jgi:hypothetical protein
MTSSDSYDARLELLARLPRVEPDSARVDRTRSRCRALLERRRHRSEHAAAMIEFARRTVASATVGGFWVLYVVYVCALVATSFGLEAVLR